MPNPGAPGTVAWMEGLLRERLGPDAVLGAVTFAGKMLRVDDVLLPLGSRDGGSGPQTPGTVLHVDHVVVELGAGPLLGELPLSARLVALAGEVRARGHQLSIAFTAQEDAGDGGDTRFAHGALRLGDLDCTLSGTVTRRRGSDDGSPPGDLEGSLVLSTARSRLVLTGAASSSLHDVRLTGRLALADVLRVLPVQAGPTVEATLDLDLTLEGTLADPTVSGCIFAAEAQISRAGGPALRVHHLSLTVDADRRRLRCSNLVVRAREARVGGWAHVPFTPRTGNDVARFALQVERVDAQFLADAAAVAGFQLPLARPGAPGLPPDLTVGGEVMVTAERAVSGSFTVETPRSSLLGRLALAADRALLGSTLRGHFAAADAVHIGLAGGPLRPRSTDVLLVDARLSGTLSRPGIAGRLSASRLAFEAVRAGGLQLPAVEIEEASVLLDAGVAALAWNQLTGRLYGGSFTSSGRLGRDTGELEATLGWSGVRVEDLPIPVPGEGSLADLLRGACSGEVRVERESFVAHALVAAGTVTVAEPVYLFVRRVAPTLERYGLPPLRARGEGPFTAHLRFEHGELIVAPAEASLDGIDVDGTLTVDRDGSLVGRVRVHLLPSYLTRSPVLAIPAAFAGRVVIPVYVRGTPGAVEIETDAIEILDGLLTGSRVGDAVKTVLDGLWSAARPSRKRR